MTETLEIDKIVKQCQKGDSKAQYKLYKLLSPRLFSICLRYAKDNTEAEDILQDGFIKIFTKIKQFQFNGSFEGWAHRVITNCALERFRKMNLMYTVGEIIEYDTQLSYNDAVSTISHNELLKIIQSLSPQYRTIFNLYAIEGYSHHEIGEMLNISENTSKSNLSRARQILKEKVELLYNTKENRNISI